MKKVQQLLVAVGAVLLSCSNAYADNPSSASAGAQSGANSQAAGTGIVGQTIQTGVQNNFPSAPSDVHTRIDISGKQVMENVPSMGSPGLTTSMSETCMGSTSGSIAVAGLGIGGGKTYTDTDCVNRLNAREIMHEGQPGAREIAKEILCTNPTVRMASKKAGYPCADDMSSSSDSSSVSSADAPKISTAESPAVVKVFPSQVAENKGSSILDDSRFRY